MGAGTNVIRADHETYGGARSGSWRDIEWSRLSREASVGGRRLGWVDTGGAGRPTVLLHGHGATWQYWLEVITQLMPDRRVIAVDLPGFGGSQMIPFAQTSMPTVIDTLRKWLDALGIESCDVVGHSLGSILAIELAVADPQRVRQLTLAGGPAISMITLFQRPLRTACREPAMTANVLGDMITAGLPIPGWLRRFVATHRLARRIALSPYVSRPAELKPDVALSLMGGVGAPAYFHIPLKARSYRVAGFERLSCPVLLVNGDRDAFVPAADVSVFTDRVPAAESVIIRGAGHLVTIEYPSTFVRLIRSFTDEEARTAS